MKNLRAAHIQKSFGQTQILSGIDLDLPEQKIGVLVGSSGSGKSTLAKIIGGLLEPDGGQILFDGQEVRSPNQKLVAGHSQIKLVSQDFGLMPYISARHNIYQGMMPLLDAEKKQISDQLLEVLSLQNVAENLAKNLSGGQQQRVAIGQMLAAKAQLYLFDEVFSQLDLATKQQVMLALKNLIKKEEASALFILHDATDAFALADVVFVLQDGQIVQEGSVFQVFNSPKNHHVAALFGVYNCLPESVFSNVFTVDQADFHNLNDEIFFRPHQLQIKNLRVPLLPSDEVLAPNFRLQKFAVSGHTFWLQATL